MGWDGMVIIGRRSSKKTFGANNRKIPSFYILEIIEIVKAYIERLHPVL